MEEESWMRSHGRGIIEDSWKRNHGGGIMEKESWKRNHGDGGIIKEKSWRRNHVGFIRGGTIEEESSESHLGAIWKASGRHLETSGITWEASGGICSASGRHLGGIWGSYGKASGRHLGSLGSQGVPKVI